MDSIHFMDYTIIPSRGIVIGLKGRPIGKVCRGYIRIQRNTLSWQAHRLIWEAVNGPIPEGMQINHKNGIKRDNRIENLEVVTPGENLRHAYRMGLACARGERNGRAIGKRRRLEAA